MHDDRRGTYVVPNVVNELHKSARDRFEHETMETLESGRQELRVEYRAAILLGQQANRIALLEATLKAIVVDPIHGSREDHSRDAALLAEGALAYGADLIPEAISTEDGDPAWVAVTPITQTPEQAIAALKVNGMWEVISVEPGKVEEYGYEVEGKVWCVPGLGRTEKLFLTHAELDSDYDGGDILWYESPELAERCETGSWWWRCKSIALERDATGADCTCGGGHTNVDGNGGHNPFCPVRPVDATHPEAAL